MTITSFVGLDIHKDSIAIAVAEAGRSAPRCVGTTVPTLASLCKALGRHGSIRSGSGNRGWYAKLQANPFEYRGLETGVRMTRFYLNRFVLDVQVDKSPAPESARYLRVEPCKPLLVPERNLESSKDLGALRPAIETYGKRRKR